jgi:hypothetical protein
MDLANMRRQGVHSLIACCLNNDACRHQAVIEVWSYPPENVSPTPRLGRSPQAQLPFPTM